MIQSQGDLEGRGRVGQHERQPPHGKTARTRGIAHTIEEHCGGGRGEACVPIDSVHVENQSKADQRRVSNDDQRCVKAEADVEAASCSSESGQ